MEDEVRRNNPGLKEEELFRWEEQKLDDMESTFAAQQYLQGMIRHGESTDVLLAVPENQEEETWLYEHIREIVLELNFLAVRLMPACTPDKYPELKYCGEVFLLPNPAPGQPAIECSAIQYILVLLDATSSTLNSNKNFPSRVTISKDSMKIFSTLARRLYRIFAFAHFSFPDIFKQFEEETHLYERFVKLSRKYKLIPEEAIVVPLEGEADDDEEEGDDEEGDEEEGGEESEE